MAVSSTSPPRRQVHPRVAVVWLNSSIFGLQTGFINLCLKNVSSLPFVFDVYSSYIYHPRFIHLLLPTVSWLLPVRGPSNPHISSHSSAADHCREGSQTSGYQIFNVRIKYDFYHWLLIHEIIVTPISRPTLLWIIYKLHPLPHWRKCNQSTNYRTFNQYPLHPGNNLVFQDIQWNGIPRQPLHRLFLCIAMIELSLSGRIQYAMLRLRHWRFMGCLIVFENLRTPAQPSRHFYRAYRRWV